MFILADKSGDGLLSVDEVFPLMHKLNVKISNRKLRETFKVCVRFVYFLFSISSKLGEEQNFAVLILNSLFVCFFVNVFPFVVYFSGTCFILV